MALLCAAGLHSADMEREQQRQEWEEREQATYQAERQAEDDRDAKIQVGGSLFLLVLVEHGNVPPQCKRVEDWWCQARPLELVGVRRL